MLAGEINTFEFLIYDVGDSNLDSVVFIQQGTFSGTPTDIPEPGTGVRIADHAIEIVQTQDRVVKAVRIFPAAGGNTVEQ